MVMLRDCEYDGVVMSSSRQYSIYTPPLHDPISAALQGAELSFGPPALCIIHAD